MNDEGTNKNMLCFFDTARIHEEECRDARVGRTYVYAHGTVLYSHEQDARLFVFLYLPCFFPAHTCLFFVFSWFFKQVTPC